MEGVFRILYDLKEDGIEITCPVCKTYSAGSELAKEHGNGVRISVRALNELPYVCECGTKYNIKLQKNHWHLFINIPKGLINQEALEVKVTSSPH